MKYRTALTLSLIISGATLSQETQKPFILEHMFHEHKVDFVNSTVYQQIDGYAAVYNSSHIFFDLKFTPDDEIFLNASITFGNGITKETEKEGYSISTTADDLEDYLKDINDTGRDYLLELFYQKSIGNFTFIGGLIDSTAFIDANRYANDEHLQFLNCAFVNNPIAVLPSYNPGVYIHYQITGSTGISGVYMQNKPDQGNVGIVEIEYETENIGIRPYYFYVFGGEELKGFGLSGDYSFGNKGLFLRIGNSNTDQDYFISGGFEISKILKNDRVGFGYGYIHGKNETDDIHVSEAYYSYSLNKHITLSLDIQYMKEVKKDFIYGSRLYLSF